MPEPVPGGGCHAHVPARRRPRGLSRRPPAQLLARVARPAGRVRTPSRVRVLVQGDAARAAYSIPSFFVPWR